MTAPGYKLDPEALEKAIKDLEGTHESLLDLRDRATRLAPGELTAGDMYTQRAHQVFEKLAVDDKNSLLAELDVIRNLLEEKIKAYKESLREYQQAEADASINTGKIQKEA